MTTHEAKADVKMRLDRAKIPFMRLSARTLNFSDLARATPVQVTIHGAQMHPSDWEVLKSCTLKPSEGGYMLTNEGTMWLSRAPLPPEEHNRFEKGRW